MTRVEDARLLTTGGTYLDDLQPPELHNAAWVTFVRSPVAHGIIAGIDTSVARAMTGVCGVLTGWDIEQPGLGGAGPGPRAAADLFAEPLLATDRVRYVGEPVALVITIDRYAGADAAARVQVEYQPLPPIMSVAAALTGSSLLFPPAGTNVAAQDGPGSFDETPFARCEVVIEQTFVNQRVAPLPLEVRAAGARWDGGALTFWVSSQNAQLSRRTLARRLRLPISAIRVIVPDVGGGFGARIGIDREAIAVAWAARHTGRDLRWAETRSENLVGMTHGRAQLQNVKIGGRRDGRVQAYRLGIVQDAGAYPRTAALLAGITCKMAPGVYDIPEVQTAYQVAVTNTTPIGAYRGAGRPEATFAIERVVDMFAAAIAMDPAEVRRRNMIKPDRFPFPNRAGALYDTGRYAAGLGQVLAGAGYPELRAEQARRRARGDVHQLGIGLAAYVEITAGDARQGESARIEVSDRGAVTVLTGSSPQGQGHDTAWTMLVQQELGVPADQITVQHGDTTLVPLGTGTHASRSLQLGGSAVYQAAAVLKAKARSIAACALEASEADLEFDPRHGAWRVKGDPAAAVSWAEIAGRADGAGLNASVNFTEGRPTFPFGTHLSVVEVDTETGKVRMIRHLALDDAGPVLNPLLAEGQRHGGIAQGAAQALLEEVLYDADGNPLTSTLMDYAAIGPVELPSFELLGSETPTPRNPLGVKGVGESGTIGAGIAVLNAVVDALSDRGVRHLDMPCYPAPGVAGPESGRRCPPPLHLARGVGWVDPAGRP